MSDIDQIVEDLKNIKFEIEDGKQELAEANGRLSEQMKRLTELGATSEKSATKLLKDLQRQQKTMAEEIIQAYEELKNQYGW